MCLLSAGQPRRARRSPQRGQITSALLYNSGRKPSETRGTCLAVARFGIPVALCNERGAGLGAAIMTDPAFRGESAVEYFKELVDGALARQHIGAGELTAFYVVHLLAGFLQQPADRDEQPLAFRLAQALEAGGTRQRTNLRQIGDLSLFIS